MSLSLIKRAGQFWVPESLLHTARRRWYQLKFFGLQRQCPLCGSRIRSFLPHGTPVRQQALCPVCQCKEAHRLAMLYLSERTEILSRPVTMLHVAPEPALGAWLQGLSRLTYISGDLQFGVGELCLNLCRLPFGDESFDLIYSAHVLNAIPDDHAAMREVCRVLKPGGIAIMNVPLQPDAATQLPDTDSRDGRMRLCNDPHIYRIYGSDLPRRFSDIPLKIELDNYYESLVPDQRDRFGLQATPVVRCTKPSPSQASTHED